MKKELKKIIEKKIMSEKKSNEKWEVTIDIILIVGKYFEINKDYQRDESNKAIP